MSADVNLSSDDMRVACVLGRFDLERLANKSSDPVLSWIAGETSGGQFLEAAGLDISARKRVKYDLLKLGAEPERHARCGDFQPTQGCGLFLPAWTVSAMSCTSARHVALFSFLLLYGWPLLVTCRQVPQSAPPVAHALPLPGGLRWLDGSNNSTPFSYTSCPLRVSVSWFLFGLVFICLATGLP